MAIHWHWAFGNENQTTLYSIGFTFPNADWFAITGASNIYTYSGSPARYALACRRDIANYCTLPAAAVPATPQGWVAVPVKRQFSATLISNGYGVITVQAGGSGSNIRVEPTIGGQALELLMANVFKASTPAYNWNDWQYVALQFNMTGSVWGARVFVNGAAAMPSQSQTVGAQTTCSLILGGQGNLSDYSLFGQIIVYDSVLDSGETPLYVTRVDPATLGAGTTGTWSPIGAATVVDALKSPMDAGTYAQEATPTTGEKLEMVINTNLTTALGTSPTVIPSVATHSLSSGQALTAKAAVGDGTGQADGANTLIDASNPTYAFAEASTKPSGGAWTGASVVELIYELT